MRGQPFQKGQSGNPGGRPKEIGEVRELARRYGPEAISVLRDVAKNGKSEAARVSAAIALLDRGFGKPKETHDQSFAVSFLAEAVAASYRPEELVPQSTRQQQPATQQCANPPASKIAAVMLGNRECA